MIGQTYMYDVIHYAKQIALHENNASKEIKGGTLNAKKTPYQIIQILEKDKKKMLNALDLVLLSYVLA